MMAAKTRRWKPNKDIQGQDLRAQSYLAKPSHAYRPRIFNRSVIFCLNISKKLGSWLGLRNLMEKK